MGVKLQSALGGSVELNAPSTASNFTMTVPAGNGTVATTDQLQNFRNKIINGGFDVWQRATSGSIIDSYASADRWKMARGTLARQQHAVNNGFSQSNYYANFSWSSATSPYIMQMVEDVTLLAGKTVTISYWAKSSASSKIYYLITQRYGTGGSSDSSVVAYTPVQQLTTSWVKYSYTLTLPTTAGKTIGTPSTSCTMFGFYGSDATAGTGNFDISDIQIEVGSVATDFERRPPGVELALCQRYFCTSLNDDNKVGWMGRGTGNYVVLGYCPFPVQMRAQPSVAFKAYIHNASSVLFGDGRAGAAIYPTAAGGGNPTYSTHTFGYGVTSTSLGICAMNNGENTNWSGIYAAGYAADAEL